MARQDSPLSGRSIRDLVDLCGRLDTDAWDEFVSRFNRLISFYVIRASPYVAGSGVERKEIARDLVQEVYSRLLASDCRVLKAWRGDTELSFKSYLASVAHAVACDAVRRDRRKKRSAHLVSLDAPVPETGTPLGDTLPASDASSPDRVFAERLAPERLRETLASMSGPNAARNAVIFQLHVIDGLTASEIAAMPGFQLQVPAVETILRRTRERLKQAFGDPDRLTG
jgi:RNA polymerase sigma factor (sigma-70 family)